VALHYTVAADSGFARGVFTFTDPMFSGTIIAPVSNSFLSPVTGSLLGDVLTLTAPSFIDFNHVDNQFDAVFSITPLVSPDQS
jgi:hypothetical protein